MNTEWHSHAYLSILLSACWPNLPPNKRRYGTLLSILTQQIWVPLQGSTHRTIVPKAPHIQHLTETYSHTHNKSEPYINISFVIPSWRYTLKRRTHQWLIPVQPYPVYLSIYWVGGGTFCKLWICCCWNLPPRNTYQLLESIKYGNLPLFQNSH